MAHTPRGYTTVARIERHFEMTLAPLRAAEATELIAVAEDYIDDATGRGWLLPAVTAEEHHLRGPLIWLRHAPILATPAPIVTGYTEWSDTGAVLVELTGYRITSLARGEIDLGANWTTYGSWYRWVTVTYSPSDTPPPASVELAATLLVGFWLQQSSSGGLAGIASYSVGGEETVTVQDIVAERGVPAEVSALLGGRAGVFV